MPMSGENVALCTPAAAAVAFVSWLSMAMSRIVLYTTDVQLHCRRGTYKKLGSCRQTARHDMPVNIMPNSAHVFSAIAIFKAGNLGE